MSRLVAVFSALAALALASDYTPFEFDWQQRLSSLGLAENNATFTASGCVQAVRRRNSSPPPTLHSMTKTDQATNGQCELLGQLLPQREILPSDSQYFKVKDFYWSAQQAAVSPQCFVQPGSAEDVSTIIKVAERAECPFAVKSGGHAAFAGASNIQDGITIDLQLLNEITVSEDRTTTRIGPGNRWVDVYSRLDAKNLMVVGGRVAEIGVGGLMLGGGISFFSARRGWALDGVRNYEVVVASGEILDVNLESYPDLYWALRGGGNNFGVVTRFDLETFPQPGMWGGMAYHSMDHNVTLNDAFFNFADAAHEDPDAQAYLAFCWVKDYESYVIMSEVTYARAVEYPEVLKPFTDVPAMSTTVRLRNMTDLALEMNATNPNGMRQVWMTGTFRMDREMLQACVDIFVEELQPVKYLNGIVPAAIVHLIGKDTIANFARNGGNCLGIEPGEGPLVNLNVAFLWADAADDEVVERVIRRVIERSEAKGRELGVWHRYIYQNYAGKDQDVFAGYGEENLRRLREISKKYDPEQVFQRLQPGYYKL